MNQRLALFVAIAFAFCPLLDTANADDGLQGQPAPESADELITSFDPGLEGKKEEETPVDQILEKSKLKLKLRNYYFDRNRAENTDQKAWAQGGSIEYNLDRLGGIFDLTAEYFGSFKLYGPDEHDGTLLLEAGQSNLDTLGVANPRAHIGQHVVSVFRQRFDLPYVNGQDNRMIPNTFEGYVIGMPKAENEKFQYILGYISEMKKRNDENFQSMSEVAGIDGNEHGMITGGARYFVLPELQLAAIDYYVEDVFNIAYAEAVHKLKINEDWANTLSVQGSEQRSVGEDLLRGEEFTTGFGGIQDAVSYKNATLKAAFTGNDTSSDIRSPYGSYPGYNSVIVEDFNRAGEKSWQVNLSYNFAGFGWKGLGISAGYVSGSEAISETTKEDIGNKDETDVTIDYKFLEGTLQGLWLRARMGIVDEEGKTGTTDDYRIIVNYEIPLYEPEAEAS